jgi:WD40 repeat protein
MSFRPRRTGFRDRLHMFGLAVLFSTAKQQLGLWNRLGSRLSDQSSALEYTPTQGFFLRRYYSVPQKNGSEIVFRDVVVHVRRSHCAVGMLGDAHLAAGRGAGRDGSVCVWDAENGTLQWRGGEHQQSVNFVVYSADGRRLASSGDDGRICVWDAATGELSQSITTDSVAVFRSVFTPDGTGLVSTCADGQLRRWNLGGSPSTGGNAQATGTRGALCVCNTADGQWLITVDDRGLVRVRQFDDALTPVRTLDGDAGEATDITCSADGRFVATAGRDAAARIWDFASCELIPTHNADGAALTTIVFSPSGELLAAGTEHGDILLWRDRAAETVERLRTGGLWIKSLGFTADGKRLISAGDSTRLHYWSLESGSEEFVTAGHAGRVNSVRFSADGAWLASAGDDGDVCLWDWPAGGHRRLSFDSPGCVRGLDFSPDSHFLTAVQCFSPSAARVWKTDDAALFHSFADEEHELRAVAYSPSGNVLAVASRFVIRIFDTRTVELKRTLAGHRTPIRSLSFSANGAWLASAGGDEPVRLWSVAEGRTKQQLMNAGGWINSVVFDAGGELLATAGSDGVVRLWDASSGRHLVDYTGHKGAVCAIAFLPDERILVSAGEDGSLRFWAVAFAKEIARRDVVAEGALTALCVSPDGQVCVAGTRQGAILTWQIMPLQLARQFVQRWNGIEDVPVEAEFVALQSGQLVLRHNSQSVKIPLANLSAADIRVFAPELLARARQSDQSLGK